MTDETAHPDELVTLTTRPTEFEAGAVVAVLRDAGIDAVAFGHPHSALPVNARLLAVPVQVRRGDVDRARRVLEQTAADSVDLDWNEVDVGEREDRLPLATSPRMPLVPRLGFAVAIVIILASLLAAAAIWLRWI